MTEKNCMNCAMSMKRPIDRLSQTPKECMYCTSPTFYNWKPITYDDILRKEQKDANETEPLTLADSGNRREFSTGAVRDIQEGKGRCDLLPMDALYQISAEDPFWSCIDNFQKNGDIFYLNRAFELLASMYCLSADRVVAQADYLLAQAVQMERGAKKYGERNWEKGIPIQSFIDSACRHYLKFLRGDTDEPHLVAAGWNIMCCMTTVIRQKVKEDNL